MKPTIKEVKEYFKNAKTIRPINSMLEVELTTKIFVLNKKLNCINEVDEKGDLLLTKCDYHCVWSKDTYAEIISYKEKTHTITDTFLKELCKEQNIKEAFIREGIVIEETYIKIPLSEIKGTPNDSELGELVRRRSENY